MSAKTISRILSSPLGFPHASADWGSIAQKGCFDRGVIPDITDLLMMRLHKNNRKMIAKTIKKVTSTLLGSARDLSVTELALFFATSSD
jgi:hypothetical protein